VTRGLGPVTATSTGGGNDQLPAGRTGKIERVKALLTGIGSPGRAQIGLFGTSYPTGLPTITSMHIGGSARVIPDHRCHLQ